MRGQEDSSGKFTVFPMANLQKWIWKIFLWITYLVYMRKMYDKQMVLSLCIAIICKRKSYGTPFHMTNKIKSFVKCQVFDIDMISLLCRSLMMRKITWYLWKLYKHRVIEILTLIENNSFKTCMLHCILSWFFIGSIYFGVQKISFTVWSIPCNSVFKKNRGPSANTLKGGEEGESVKSRGGVRIRD